MGNETVSSNGEPDMKEAEALAAALNHSAERVQTLWFSFLTFMLYLAVATGTTTHRMLFLEEPLNLPVLNINRCSISNCRFWASMSSRRSFSSSSIFICC
jgi:hypothetical protein